MAESFIQQQQHWRFWQVRLPLIFHCFLVQLPHQLWGAFALNLGGALTTAGALTTVGAFGATFTFTNTTSVTFPTSGTLATTTGSVATLTGDSGTATASAGNINVVGGTTGLTFTGAAATLTLGGTNNVAHGGTGLAAVTAHNLMIGAGTSALTLLAPSATSGIPLVSQGASADPAYGTAVVAGGGTGVTSVTTSPTATAFAGWDANRNMSADSFLSGYTTTATAAGTTTLTVNDTYWQFFTGATTQTVTLPVTSTLALGQTFFIVNISSGAVTVNSSGGNAVQVMAANTSAIVTCVLTSGTSAASWSVIYYFNGGGSGTVAAGTQNQIAWYAATGTTVSGLSPVASGVLVTSAGSVPSFSTTLPSGLAATNLTLTTPVLGTPQSGDLSNVGAQNSVTLTSTGTTGGTQTAYYCKVGKQCFISLDMTGDLTSNANTSTFTGLPFTAGTTALTVQYLPVTRSRDNGANTFGNVWATIADGGTTITFALNGSTTGWTNSGGKTRKLQRILLDNLVFF